MAYLRKGQDMRGPDVLMLWKAFLRGDDGAGATLADAYEEIGETGMSKDVRDGTVRIVYDDEEAKGEVCLQRSCWGPGFLMNGRTVGYLDFFVENEGPGTFTLYTEGHDEPLCKIVYNDGGEAVLVVNGDSSRYSPGLFHKEAMSSRDVCYHLPNQTEDSSSE